MNVTRTLRRTLVGLGLAAAVVPASATTLRRASLDELTTTNSTIVVGQAIGARSYWNDEGTFILTDVSVVPSRVLKGRIEEPEVTVTLMGGSVDDLTTVIVGGAELVPGKTYVLFLNEEDLPGARGARTVRDHCQGVFEIVKTKDGSRLRAVSQASGHPLVPDRFGDAEAPGGVEGYPLADMMRSIRETAGREPERRTR